jgi:hypothetical protein
MNMNLLSSFFYAFLMLILPVAEKKSGNGISYQCHRVSGKINIDGVADDPQWDEAEAGVFLNMEGGIPGMKTTFRWLWDDEFLYGFFHLEDDHIWATLTERDAYLWNENVIEFFIDADGCPKSYFEFEVNPQNAVLDLFVLNRNMARQGIRQWWSWDCEGFKSAVTINGTLNNNSDLDHYWEVEVAIPLAQIDTAPHHPPLPGDQWKVNFCRAEGQQEGGTRESSAWSPPAFHNPNSYGTFVFVK